MEKIKLISLQGLQQFLVKLKAWIEPLLEALDTKIDKKVWKGTQAELEMAISKGEIDEKTLVIVTDDDSEEIIYQFATYQDVLNLFPQYKTV